MKQVQQSKAPAQAIPVQDTAAPTPQAPQKKKGGKIRVISGADAEDMAVVGKTVAQVRALVKSVYGIDQTAVALVDGKRVTEDTILESNQQLEFVKHAGQKG